MTTFKLKELTAMTDHAQLIFIMRLADDIAMLIDAAEANDEPRLAAYLRAAWKAVELATAEAKASEEKKRSWTPS